MDESAITAPTTIRVVMAVPIGSRCGFKLDRFKVEADLVGRAFI